MCHGSFLERAALSVPDLLRDRVPLEPYLEPQSFDELFSPNVYGSANGSDLLLVGDQLLPRSSISGDTLTDIFQEFASEVKKIDHKDDEDAEDDDATLGSLSAWFDSIVREDERPVTSSPQKTGSTLLSKSGSDPNISQSAELAPKSRKAQKSAKDQDHHVNDSEMDDAAPTVIDDKKKRRMSSNRASAQRSRQRKQDRLDQLEILTAQLRLENATLLRKSKLAVQLAKKYEGEKNSLAKRVEELLKELNVNQQKYPSTPESMGESITNHRTTFTGICNMVEEGSMSPPQRFGEFDAPSEDNPEQKPLQTRAPPNQDAKKQTISATNPLESSLFQGLFDSMDTEKFNLTIDRDIQDEWLETLPECLSA